MSKILVMGATGIVFISQLSGLNNMGKRLLGSLEVSNNKLKSQLGWTSPVRSADGLSRTVNWYQNEYNP